MQPRARRPRRSAANDFRWHALSLLVWAGFVLTSEASAQTATVLTVDREDATLVITNRGLSVEGSRTLLGRQGCEEGVSLSVFYGPPDEVELVIDGETTLRSSVAILREPVEADEEATDQQTIEMLDGAAEFTDRPACLEEVVPAEERRVRLEQGRTEVVGSRFFLDQETDVALLEGPIELFRAQEGESEPLEATAESLSYDLDSKLSTLTGGVRVIAGDRVSEADRLVLDEEIGLATLSGSPARSTMGDDRIEGETLLYYLDSNDVVVVGGVKGTLEVELD